MNEDSTNRRPRIEPRIIIQTPSAELLDWLETLKIQLSTINASIKPLFEIETFNEAPEETPKAAPKATSKATPKETPSLCQDAQECLKRFYVVSSDSKVPSGIDLLEYLGLHSQSSLTAYDGGFPSPVVNRYRESIQVHPPAAKVEDPFRIQQEYLDRTGINVGNLAKKAKADVQLVDIEQGWGPRHEDLPDIEEKLIFGENFRFHGHGTSVLGILAARENDRGVVGILPGHLNFSLASQYWKDEKRKCLSFTTVEPLFAALCHPKTKIKNGDIVLLQTQYRRDSGELLPSEVETAVHCLIQVATKHDILVVQAAGNGAINLDTVVVNGKRPFVDGEHSGALVVAASSSGRGYEPLHYTNRGSRVDCFAWGEDVTTCGDGETGRRPDEYRADFGGTSAAAAIIAGAAALIQSLYRTKHGGKSLPRSQLAALLTDPKTGVDRRALGIGVMPDVTKIADKLGV